MNYVSIKYKEIPTPWFQYEFTLINNFRVKEEDTLWFIKDQMIVLYLYHPTDNFEKTILDVWAEISDGEESRKISWEESWESDFRLFYTNIK
jgi:hypothetical protein